MKSVESYIKWWVLSAYNIDAAHISKKKDWTDISIFFFKASALFVINSNNPFDFLGEEVIIEWLGIICILMGTVAFWGMFQAYNVAYSDICKRAN